ncbi:MAG TPA: hypothetical protein VE974_17545 [Thermoanaerobaculia bacterium]|nr:hypothetical protein [Thermoanaerobaculia bacterium]
MKHVWRVLFALAVLWIAALVQRGVPLAVDEVEFFRATKWIGEGRVPFRDFWEHHTPLQWLVFAPVARLFADGPDVASIVTMRWAQVLAWIAIFALLLRFARRAYVNAWPALVLLLVSSTFVRKAVEYRVDVPGNLGFIAAIALVAAGGSVARWIGFGALMSAAVLANMRLAPLVVVTALLALFRKEERWRFNARALWMLAGVAAMAGSFIAYLMLTGAWTPFLEAIFDYNVTSARLLEVDTFFDALLAPFWTLDAGGIAFWLAALAGLVLALRERGPLQFMALLALASIATVAIMEVQYDYHFQTTWLLLMPFAALAIVRWPRVFALVAAVALAIFVVQLLPSFGAEMQYQDDVMTMVDRVTQPEERVFDGSGFALRREPSYRYWFLTTGVRMMAQRDLLEPYDIAADPPAAVIADYRLRVYLEAFPRTARYATTHYLPLYRNLWVPGMTALVGPQPTRAGWIAPRAGRYDVHASAALATHPWFTQPLAYAATVGRLAPQYAVPLRRLPPLAADALQWSVDGIAQPRGTRTLTLRKGSRVELIATPGRAAGVLLVSHGTDTLALAPAEPFVF